MGSITLTSHAASRISLVTSANSPEMATATLVATLLSLYKTITGILFCLPFLAVIVWEILSIKHYDVCGLESIEHVRTFACFYIFDQIWILLQFFYIRFAYL